MGHPTKTLADEERLIEKLLATGREDALVARLANRKVDRFFDLELARVLVRSICPPRGHLERLAQRVLDERVRQEKLHSERKALQNYVKASQEPFVAKLARAEKAGVAIDTRRNYKERFAEIQFGSFVQGIFADEVIALLALMQHERRTWKIRWLDCAAKPAISALIEVVVYNEKGEEKGKGRFLLYKIPGTQRVVAIETGNIIETCKDAFAAEVPEIALVLKAKGFIFKTDFEQQALLATSPDGDVLTLHWQGKALCTG